MQKVNIITWLRKFLGIPNHENTARLLLGNPEIKTWLDTHITGDRLADLKAFRRAFDLELAVAVEILNAYAERK